MINIIDLIFMFVVLPIIILADSWKRLRRVGWEWVVFGLLIMSLYYVFLEELLPGLFGGNDFISIIIPRLLILVGVGIFFGIYSSVEQPILERGHFWRVLRMIPALAIGVVWIMNVPNAIKGELGPSLYTWILRISGIAFIIIQIPVLILRDKDKIAEYKNRVAEEEKNEKSNTQQT